jgi:hypothetical protein
MGRAFLLMELQNQSWNDLAQKFASPRLQKQRFNEVFDKITLLTRSIIVEEKLKE